MVRFCHALGIGQHVSVGQRLKKAFYELWQHHRSSLSTDLFDPWGPQFSAAKFENSAANLVNSAAHRGNTDEILRLTAVIQVKCSLADLALVDSISVSLCCSLYL